MTGEDNSVLPVEVFAAKDSSGQDTGVFIAAPCRCGLKQADTLRVDGLALMALRNRSILPIDLPNLSVQSRASLAVAAQSAQRVPVAEFTATGLFDGYFLNLEVVR
jgi:hypothetical protein